MGFEYWLKGILLGFSIAAPVGPIGLLCIRRTLDRGRLTGFVTGLGAATADAFYGAVAAFGLTVIISLLTGIQLWLRLLGGAFLVYLGIASTLRGKAVTTGARGDSSPHGLLGAYGSTVLLTLSNPATILAFLTIFAGAGVASSTQSIEAAIFLVAGVFTGSCLWWLLLSTLVSWLGSRLSPQMVTWVNRLAGAALSIFGLVILLSAIPSAG